MFLSEPSIASAGREIRPFVRINGKKKRFMESCLPEYVQRRTESSRGIGDDRKAPSWRRPSSARVKASPEASIESFLYRMKDL